MRQIAFAVLMVALGLGRLAAAPMSKEDRQHVVAHLEMTGSWLADEVSGLSPAQLNFRYAPGKWTILDVVEHLTLSEPQYWTDLQKEVKQPPAKTRQQVSDTDMLWYGIDRTDRQKTSPSEEPKGKFTDVQVGLAGFLKLRAAMLDYARNTDDDLRAHAYPEWSVDCYQALLGISTHSQRHILQIREIKAQPGFPKKQL
jgi:DinB superfamily